MGRAATVIRWPVLGYQPSGLRHHVGTTVRLGELAHCPSCRRALFRAEGVPGGVNTLSCPRCPMTIRVTVLPAPSP